MSSTADNLDREDQPAPLTATVVPRATWRPIGIEDLEPTAWAALRDTGNVAVVAGPGAGKTEFLAQRAAYFLQTGVCPWSQRILAISFKRDAAANLGRRVTARVPEHAGRFVSMTFDAFTKGMVDRFGAALPANWRMTDGYDISTASSSGAIRAFINDITPSAPQTLRWQIARLQPDRFMPDIVGGWNLPETIPTDEQVDAAAYAAREWWRERYLLPGRAQLDFVMLNRLAELLIRTAPKLRRALRMTYPIVFVDEFQDTTNAQFSFLTSVFGGGTAVTAVGDGKQRIMGWAGALPEALGRFSEAFGAMAYPLTWNFRSSDALVELQHVIASKLDPNVVRAASKATAENEHDPAVLWTFSTLESEAAFIADWIAHDIATSDRAPADFALIARQRISEFEPRFRDRLAAHGIRVRNDDALVGKMRLQDLLKNEPARLLLGLLQLAVQPSGLVTVWRDVSATMARVDGATDDEALRRVGENLTEVTTTLRTWLNSHPPGVTSSTDTVQQLVDLIGIVKLRRYVKSTTPGEDLDIITDAFETRLQDVTDAFSNWKDTLDEFECVDAVTLLTAHRSKGLEYHTVFFLGIHEQQWWAFQRDPREGTSTFFVGLSRAAHRLIFTTDRSNRTGSIAALFAMLNEAGVPEIDRG